MIIRFIHLLQKYMPSHLTHAKVLWYFWEYMTWPQILENLASNPLLNPISNCSTHPDNYLLWFECHFYCNSL